MTQHMHRHTFMEVLWNTEKRKFTLTACSIFAPPTLRATFCTTHELLARQTQKYADTGHLIGCDSQGLVSQLVLLLKNSEEKTTAVAATCTGTNTSRGRYGLLGAVSQ